MMLIWIELLVCVLVLGVGGVITNLLGWGIGGYFAGIIFTFLLAQILRLVVDWYKEKVLAKWNDTYKQADDSFRAEIARQKNPPQSRH